MILLPLTGKKLMMLKKIPWTNMDLSRRKKEEEFVDESKTRVHDNIFNKDNEKVPEENVKSKKRKKKTEVEKLATDNKEFQVPITGKRTMKIRISNPTMNVIQTAKNYQNIMQAFTNRPEVNSTVQNVVNRSDTTFSFPEYITDASQVGVVTSALICGATQAIASHVRVNHLQGAAQGADVLVGEQGDERKG